MPMQIDNHNAEVKVRRYSGSAACDVIVRKRGKEMVLGCRDYDQAVKWARIECKTYGVSAVSVERADKGWHRNSTVGTWRHSLASSKNGWGEV